jgi:3'-5' exoribonuclease
MYGPELVDENLVVAGVVLHDLAKCMDFNPSGIGWEYSDHARLIGHIPFMAHLILSSRAADGHHRQQLAHVVLSHHGRLDYGSPVEPRTIEAVLVHQVDMIDSRVGMYRSAIEHAEGGDWVWVKALRREVQA